MDIGSTIGQRIVFFRDLKGWNQMELCKATGIKQSRMSKIQNGHNRPSFDEVDRIALFLEQPLQYFSMVRKVVLPANMSVVPPDADRAANG